VSNLSDLTKAWGLVDKDHATDVWSMIGSVVGLVADVAGAVSGIGAVAELASTIIGLTSDANAAIEAQLQTVIAVLNKRSSAANKSLRGAIGALIIPVALTGAPTFVQSASG
jgi:hypothetical protein